MDPHDVDFSRQRELFALLRKRGYRKDRLWQAWKRIDPDWTIGFGFGVRGASGRYSVSLTGLVEYVPVTRDIYSYWRGPEQPEHHPTYTVRESAGVLGRAIFPGRAVPTISYCDNTYEDLVSDCIILEGYLEGLANPEGLRHVLAVDEFMFSLGRGLAYRALGEQDEFERLLPQMRLIENDYIDFDGLLGSPPPKEP